MELEIVLWVAAVEDQGQPFRHRPDIFPTLRLSKEPTVKLSRPAKLTQIRPVLPHEDIGCIRVFQMVDQKTVNRRYRKGGISRIRRFFLEELPVKTDRNIPFPRILCCHRRMEQQFLRLGRVRIQPTLYGGKGFGRTVLTNSYLEDFDNGCLFLFRGVLEDLYLFIERGRQNRLCYAEEY